MTAIDDVNVSSMIVPVDARIVFQMETTKYTHILKHLMFNINSPLQILISCDNDCLKTLTFLETLKFSDGFWERVSVVSKCFQICSFCVYLVKIGFIDMIHSSGSFDRGNSFRQCCWWRLESSVIPRRVEGWAVVEWFGVFVVGAANFSSLDWLYLDWFS
jgi:hypothetical protein